MPRTLRGYIVLALLILIVGYGLYVGRNYLYGVSLAVEVPKDGATLTGSYLLVEGRARRASHLFVNGAKVYPDETGSFRYALLVPPGYSIIDVVAEDRFLRKKLIRRAVYLPHSSTTTSPTS